MNKNTEKSSNWKNWIIKKLLSNDSTKEEILNFIANDSEQEKSLEDLNENDEKNLIKNILKLNEKSVDDIMVPRSEIVAVNLSQTYEEILDLIKTESHSRMPIYNKNLDEIMGFFHIKDFLKNEAKNFNLKLIMRDNLFVAPKSPILDLLKTMRSSRIHIALVVDGVGGVDGLVTIEDLVEEIVGEIEDEHDAEDSEDLVIEKNRDSMIVDSSFRIEDLENSFNIKIDTSDEDEINTVGGLVYANINRIPKNNEIFYIGKNLKIKIISSNERKIKTLEIEKLSS
tara:strand:+ start:887 stop:1738 length:852 start_codon:yes stop_codon:yes gene_type:complete